VLLTYPFTDEVLRGVKGDYLNTYLSMVAAPGTEVIPPLESEDMPSPAPASDPASPLSLPSVSGTGTGSGGERS
jgi:phospholipid/cholesterol/gamma-HCH transport system substrate-binding protein